MPYKNREKQLKYMQEYQKFMREQRKKAQGILSRDDLKPAAQLDLLGQILRRKPSIDVWGDTPQKKPKKRR